MENFKKLGLSQETIEVLMKKGYSKPTPIQEKTIPVLMEGQLDVIGQAQTGTGKTACFALPIIETIDERDAYPQALVLAPTRELAIQVSQEIDSLKGQRRLKVLTVYGGSSIMNQINALKRGVHIVVGTPGRVIDLINRRKLDISGISFAVLDEADEMLNMGFVDDIKTILSQTKEDKRMLMFSATMPREIANIAKQFMRKHVLIEVKRQQDTHELTEQIYFNIKANDRFEGIRRILAVNEDFYGIIFCKTKVEVDQLARKLADQDYPAAAIHGDFSQAQRENVFNRFKSKKIRILIATDVAARGLDVNNLTHVVNYSLPQTPEGYVHRIGRTGRAGKKGVAITFVMPSESRQLRFIERILKNKLVRMELPEASEVIEMKRNEIISRIKKIITAGNTTKFRSMTKEILDDNDPETVIAAVLKYAFQNELNPHTYKDITHVEEAHHDERPMPSKHRPRQRENKPRFGKKRKKFDDWSGKKEKFVRKSKEGPKKKFKGRKLKNIKDKRRPRHKDSGNYRKG